MPPEIKTRNEKHPTEESGDEPVSPTGQFLNSAGLSLCILCVLELEVPIDESCASTRLQHAFLPVNPRFSSVMVTDDQGVKKWKRVEVKLQEHVITPIFPPLLSSELYDDYFDEYLTKIAADQLPQNKPLWELHLVNYPTSKAVGQAIFKVDHALGDGYTLMGTLLSCFQRAEDPSLPLTLPRFPSKSSSSSLSCMNMIKSIPKAISIACNTLCDFGWSMLMSTVVEDSKTPIRSGTENVEHRQMEIGTLELDLAQVKEIKAALGVTINDVITGIICYGVREYMQGKSGSWASSHSTALVLLNTRNIDGYKTVSDMLRTKAGRKTLWGNQSAFLHLAVPKVSDNNSLDPLKFVFEARRMIQRKKRSLAFHLTGQMLEIIRNCAGHEAVARFVHKTMKNSNLIITNLIGPVEKMAFDANHPVKGLYFMLIGSPQNMTVSVLSYMQTLRISIGVEKGFISLQELRSCTQNAFEVLVNAVTMTG